MLLWCLWTISVLVKFLVTYTSLSSVKKSINSVISKYRVLMNLQAVRVQDTMRKPCTWTGSKKGLVHNIEPIKLFSLIGKKKLHNVDQLRSNPNARGVASKM